MSRTPKKVPVPVGFRQSLEGQIPRTVSRAIEDATGLKVSYETVRQIKEGDLTVVTPKIAERIAMYMRKKGMLPATSRERASGAAAAHLRGKRARDKRAGER